ncbi:MAG TPA: 50S ribosomal protein L11 methyltransferase [Coxiellaceae bacterium]|nr:50S ribosomal protein L11 methyltransferase [Coxiellaceae bacterium]
MKTLIINSSAEDAELLTDFLNALGAQAVSLINASTEELFQLQPEHSPLWQETQIKTIYPDETDFERIIQTIENWFGKKLNYHVEDIIEQDWVRLTQASFKPLHFANRLSIYPSWYKFEDQTPTQIHIDPGLAFGTGTHPTTQLCLEWLALNPPLRKSVIDYGCGSGILALSALALGANPVWAVDHDPQALEATQQNAALNHFQLTTCLPEEHPELKVDLILANILANPLISLAEKLHSLLKSSGILVLSGLLETEIPQLTSCYSNYFKTIQSDRREGWARLVLSA